MKKKLCCGIIILLLCLAIITPVTYGKENLTVKKVASGGFFKVQY